MAATARVLSPGRVVRLPGPRGVGQAGLPGGLASGPVFSASPGPGPGLRGAPGRARRCWGWAEPASGAANPGAANPAGLARRRRGGGGGGGEAQLRMARLAAANTPHGAWLFPRISLSRSMSRELSRWTAPGCGHPGRARWRGPRPAQGPGSGQTSLQPQPGTGAWGAPANDAPFLSADGHPPPGMRVSPRFVKPPPAHRCRQSQDQGRTRW